MTSTSLHFTSLGTMDPTTAGAIFRRCHALALAVERRLALPVRQECDWRMTLSAEGSPHAAGCVHIRSQADVSTPNGKLMTVGVNLATSLRMSIGEDGPIIAYEDGVRHSWDPDAAAAMITQDLLGKIDAHGHSLEAKIREICAKLED